MLVVINHTSFFHIPFNREPGLNAYILLHVSILIKVAVPLFFMITGALLLPKTESFSALFRKRIFRFACVIVVFQIIQHLYACFETGSSFCMSSFTYDVIKGKSAAPATWFLYTYLAVLLLLPLLRTLAKNMSNQHFLYLFALHLLTTSFFPINTALQDWLVLSNFHNGQNVFIYIFAGYFIETRLPHIPVSRRVYMMLIPASLCSVLLGAYMCEWGREIQQLDHYTQAIPCFQGCIFIPCITFFLAAKRYDNIWSGNRYIQKALTILGGGVFSLMLIENILRDNAFEACSELINSKVISGILALTFVYVVGFALGIFLKKLPVIKKFV